MARWGGYTVNLIHYEDAARLCVAVSSSLYVSVTAVVVLDTLTAKSENCTWSLRAASKTVLTFGKDILECLCECLCERMNKRMNE